jgi:hypothetical protein
MARSAFHRRDFYERNETIGANQARRYFRDKFIEAIGRVTLDQALAGAWWGTSDLQVMKAEFEGARATAIRKLRGRSK